MTEGGMMSSTTEYDETNTTVEEFDAMWEKGEPAETIGPNDRLRKRLISVVAGTIWEYRFRKSGTVASGMDLSDDGLAAAVVDHFTCPECKFVDMFEGNDGGVCNDCAPRVTARKRQGAANQ